jgi:hypothetical protein
MYISTPLDQNLLRSCSNMSDGFNAKASKVRLKWETQIRF